MSKSGVRGKRDDGTVSVVRGLKHPNCTALRKQKGKKTWRVVCQVEVHTENPKLQARVQDDQEDGEGG